MQDEIMEHKKKEHDLIQKYKAECKAVFGLADGDQTNVLEMIKTISKVLELNA
jgi:hypothetical protein